MVNAEAPRLMRVLVNYSPAPRVVDEIELPLASSIVLPFS